MSLNLDPDGEREEENTIVIHPGYCSPTPQAKIVLERESQLARGDWCCIENFLGAIMESTQSSCLPSSARAGSP